MLDEDYGDITDPTEGRDVKVTCSKAPGRQWATTEVRPRGKQGLLNEDKKQAKIWLDSMPNLDDMYELKSYDELEKIVSDWLNGDDATDDIGTSRAPVVVADSSTSETSSTTTKYASLDDAFADLEDL
jgi:hypothetical protein